MTGLTIVRKLQFFSGLHVNVCLSEVGRSSVRKSVKLLTLSNWYKRCEIFSPRWLNWDKLFSINYWCNHNIENMTSWSRPPASEKFGFTARHSFWKWSSPSSSNQFVFQQLTELRVTHGPERVWHAAGISKRRQRAKAKHVHSFWCFYIVAFNI